MPPTATTTTTTTPKVLVAYDVEQSPPALQPIQRNVVVAKIAQTAGGDVRNLLPSGGKSRSKSNGYLWLLMTIAALIIAGYALFFLFVSTPGDQQIRERILKNPISWIHIVGGLVAMATGPFQFIQSVRKQRPYLHRISGRVYAAAVILGAFGGFDISFRSLAHPIGQWGFALLAFSWLTTCMMMLSTIWRGDVGEHRKWAIRNYSLTYAAVMLRWELPVLLNFGATVPLALTITSLGCWVPNLIYAEWHLKHT